MTDATCSLPDCGKPRYQRQRMCASHFMKQYRYGDPYYKAPIRFRDITGQRFGNLTPIERFGGSWRCRCDCGAETTVLTGDLNRGNARSCGNARIHWRTETPGYFDVHRWLTVDRGPATAHACTDCGKPARQWSYDNADPDELIDKGLRYSRDLDHYVPRCLSCHKRFDIAERDRTGRPRRG